MQNILAVERENTASAAEISAFFDALSKGTLNASVSGEIFGLIGFAVSEDPPKVTECNGRLFGVLYFYKIA